MKLLYCGHCGDIFNLKLQEYQECQCGQSAGFYTDNLYAIYSGNQAVCLGISNPSFHLAILYRDSEEKDLRNFDAWVMPPEPAHITKVENAKECYEKMKKNNFSLSGLEDFNLEKYKKEYSEEEEKNKVIIEDPKKAVLIWPDGSQRM